MEIENLSNGIDAMAEFKNRRQNDSLNFGLTLLSTLFSEINSNNYFYLQKELKINNMNE